MIPIPLPVRLYHPQGVDRVAEVSADAVPGQANTYWLRIRRGPRRRLLGKDERKGPFPIEEIHEEMRLAVEQLKTEGYFKAGLHAQLLDLKSPQARVRARAAGRLGWIRQREAVDSLLARLPQAVDDTCSLLDALGAVGDAKAIPELRTFAQRKLLSRRRSAVEALRCLNDTEGLAQIRQQALERLPGNLRQALETLDEDNSEPETVQSLLDGLSQLPNQDLGLALDTLYELATPLLVQVTRQALGQVQFDQAHVWRYVKSIYKRALLRHDPVTFGLLSYTIDQQARHSTGTLALVKSGYDGKQRQTGIFRQKTQMYMRRLSWRYLRLLAQHRPEQYPHAAAEVLVAYRPEDAGPAQLGEDPYSTCYLLHRILWGGSERFVLDERRLRFRYRSARHTVPPTGRVEAAYAEWWDLEPWAYLRVLGGARILEAHHFAVRAFQAHPNYLSILGAASHAQILALLRAPYQPTVEIGLDELDRRFNPDQPDWELLTLLLGDENARTRTLGRRWLRQTMQLWTLSAHEILAFLQAPYSENHDLIISLARDTLAVQPELRQELARLILDRLGKPEVTAGSHTGMVLLAHTCLLGDLNALASVSALLALITSGSPSAQMLAGELLGYRPEAVQELGLERLLLLAEHEIAAVRAASHHLLRAAAEWLQRDPSCLFILVESEWADTRQAAFDLLRTKIDAQQLGLDGLVGLLDSNRLDVQEMGRELVIQHFASWPTAELLDRLVQHPHPRMRRFAVELVSEHLAPGAEALGKLHRFFRSAIFDLWPSRREKRLVVELLIARGLQEPAQAETACVLLHEVVYFQGRADFERALEGLVRLKLAYPEVAARVALQGEVV